MPQVAIVGAGFAGIVLALFLKQHNITSTIYELRSRDYSRGGNIALAPNALRVLDHIGIYDRIRTHGFNYAELHFDNGAGEPLGRFLNGSRKVYNFDALRIHRSIVRDELIEALDRAAIPIYYGKKCKGIINETDTNAIIAFEDGETVTADFVVGADGIHSRIRAYIAPELPEPSFSGLMGIMGTVMGEQLSASDKLDNHGRPLSLPCMLFGATGSFAIMPASFTGSEVGYFATLEGTDRGREGWAALEENKSELYDMLLQRFASEEGSAASWPPAVRALIKNTPKETLTSWPFYSVPHLDSWSSLEKKRAIVIGDAAHAIPPTGGQGAAMAFEDAETLAYVFGQYYKPYDPSTPVTTPSMLAAILKAWERHRIERIGRVLEFTTKNGSLRKSSPHFYEQAAKEWVIWAALKWAGPEGGARWMYSYASEDVLKCLP